MPGQTNGLSGVSISSKATHLSGADPGTGGKVSKPKHKSRSWLTSRKVKSPLINAFRSKIEKPVAKLGAVLWHLRTDEHTPQAFISPKLRNS